MKSCAASPRSRRREEAEARGQPLTPSLSPSDGGRVAEGRVRGIPGRTSSLASAGRKLKLGLQLWITALVMFNLHASTAPLVSELKSDETILFYPTLAAPATNGGWDVRIHGCVFELEKRGITLAALRVALRLDGIKMNDDELALFKERGRLFLADNERNHRVVVRIAGQAFDLGESAPNGHFGKEIHLDASVLTNCSSPGLRPPSPLLPKERRGQGEEWSVLEFSAVLKPEDTRKFAGIALVLPATGVSVISDIDDTIKISDVLNHDALVRRTLLQPFEAVPGMAEVYRTWATNGAEFHYVTASPWQLHLPLLEFTRTNNFPQGSWHMKQWRLKDRTYRSIFENPEKYKEETIAPLLRQFPQRRFVLVGDSGERDPEAYAALAREFPQQVAAIFIRNVTGQGADAERYKTNFAGLPDKLWRVFKEPSEITPLLP